MAKKGYSPAAKGDSEREGKMVGAGAFAGMPSEVSFKAYPKAKEYGPSNEDDTINRIDAENGRAHSKSRKNMSNQH